jgi:1,4-alpha-glucan branching enzyme
MAIGGLTIALHGHLPYVLRHGVWPHGEDWLYEAAAETYLPLLAMLGHCALHQVSPRLVLGLTPVLLEQLDHDLFKQGFEHYLADRIERAQQDRAEFERSGEAHLAHLANRWEQCYGQLSEQFSELGRDICSAFARHAQAGQIELLTSAATHAYLPLLYEDSSIRAQVRAGIASSRRILGVQPKGMWLPECAYRPQGPWQSPIGSTAKDHRIGVEHLVADEGIEHFFVEHHLIERSNSEYALGDGQWHKVSPELAPRDPGRGWRSVHEAHGVNSDGTAAYRVAALGRDPQVCEQVWSGTIGYPAHGTYLEFHKKQGERRGLRYWKITGEGVGLGAKDAYQPDDVDGLVYEHARHFCDYVKQRLWDYRRNTGRYGLVVATFDAELFGHWWYEGPQFLRDVVLTLNADPDVELTTAAEHLEQHPPDKLVSIPEGSWGEGGDHRVWSNSQVDWMWDIEYRCEANFGKATLQLPWQSDAAIKQLLEKCGRELLLLQASDWGFAIARGQALDYGIKRFMQHVSRFEVLLDLAEKLARDSAYLGKLNEVEQFEVKDAELHDVIFADIDLDWWRM